MNGALLAATLATTTWAGSDFAGFLGDGVAARVLSGLPYAVAALAVLLAHEMGHWLLARAWGMETTLPYFVPAPFGFGTLGAVIRLRSAMPSRDAVVDVGAGGPIGGALVAIPLYAWGLAHSEVRHVGALPPSNTTSLWSIAQALLHGQPLQWGGDAMVFGDSLVTWGIQQLVVGPLAAGADVVIHPVALAAWLGLFVTTLNLIPLGQLDGGHVVYGWLGERGARLVSRLVSWALLAAGVFVSLNWFVWWGVTRFLVGLRHPPALDEAPPSPGRRWLAVASLLLFAATFVPVPLRL